MKRRLTAYLVFSLFPLTSAFGADAEASARFSICAKTFAYNVDLTIARTGAKREPFRQYTDAMEAQISIHEEVGKIHISIFRDYEDATSCRPQITYFSAKPAISREEMNVISEIYSSLSGIDLTTSVNSMSAKCIKSLPKRWDAQNHKEGKSQHVLGASVDCTSDLFTDSSTSTELMVYPESTLNFYIRTGIVVYDGDNSF